MLLSRYYANRESYIDDYRSLMEEAYQLARTLAVLIVQEVQRIFTCVNLFLKNRIIQILNGILIAPPLLLK